MNRRLFVAPLLALAIGCLPATAGAQDSALQQGEYQGVRYLSGGISLDEREQMFFASSDYNLKLGFAEKGGSYIADTEVVVTTRDGRKVLELIAQGPFVLARLPAGNYRITASSAGKPQSRDATVPEKGQRELMFYW